MATRHAMQVEIYVGFVGSGHNILKHNESTKVLRLNVKFVVSV